MSDSICERTFVSFSTPYEREFTSLGMPVYNHVQPSTLSFVIELPISPESTAWHCAALEPLLASAKSATRLEINSASGKMRDLHWIPGSLVSGRLPSFTLEDDAHVRFLAGLAGALLLLPEQRHIGAALCTRLPFARLADLCRFPGAQL